MSGRRWRRFSHQPVAVCGTRLQDKGRGVVLLKSNDFMNLNGRAIARAFRHYSIDGAAHVLVVHDDLDRALGKLSWKVAAHDNQDFALTIAARR